MTILESDSGKVRASTARLKGWFSQPAVISPVLILRPPLIGIQIKGDFTSGFSPVGGSD
jgi:hypothetical protein